jgi:hypothetical protein
VDRVEIRPGTVHASAGSVFELEARVRDKQGNVLAIADFAGLSVEWSSDWPSPETDVIEGPSRNPVIVHVPEASGGTLELTAEVTRSWTDSGGGEHTSRHTGRATIRISPGFAPGDDSDWLLMTHVDPNPPAAALVQAMDGNSPVMDWAVGVVGSARLGRNLTKNVDPSSRIPGLAVFARDRSAYAEADPWSSAVDVSSLPPKGARTLMVRVGLHDGTGTIPTDAVDLIERTDGLFGVNRVGIRLQHDATFLHGRQVDGVPYGIDSVTMACATTVVNDALSGPDGSEPYDVTDPAQAALYVLFVPSIGTGQGLSKRGWACEPEVAWESRVVYLAWQDSHETTVAHEIAHLLSFMDDYLQNHGHTKGWEGFDASNLMWGDESESDARARRHLTVGQVYRMNFHPHSWVNVRHPGGFTRDCDRNRTRSAECPALSADFGG